jgi:ankyrin repeat protein
MHAVALGSLDEIERLLAYKPNLTARDRWKRTPLLLSLQTGNLIKTQLCLRLAPTSTTSEIAGKPR